MFRRSSKRAFLRALSDLCLLSRVRLNNVRVVVACVAFPLAGISVDVVLTTLQLVLLVLLLRDNKPPETDVELLLFSAAGDLSGLFFSGDEQSVSVGSRCSSV